MITNIDIGSNLFVTNSVTSNNIIATGLQLNVTGSNPQGLTINGTARSGNATQIFFQEEGITLWQLGPNYTSGDPQDFWLSNNISGYNTLQIHATLLLIEINSSINVSGSLTLTENLTAITINPNNTIVSYSGSKGTAYLSQPFAGQSYKKVLMMFESYVSPITTSTVTFTFPATFSSTLTEYATYNPHPLDITLNTGSVIISFDPGAIYTTSLVIEGW